MGCDFRNSGTLRVLHIMYSVFHLQKKDTWRGVGKTWNRWRNQKRRKWSWSWGWDIWGVGRVGVVGNGWGVRKLLGNFRVISGRVPEIVGYGRNLWYHMHIPYRQNNILIHGLSQKYPTIMIDSPVQYLRNWSLSPIHRFHVSRFPPPPSHVKKLFE